ncbi:MAG: hypothetical protein GY822_30480 [Deltaproteobacteria bacterium]|nr:hypothetical protein [Deltaproteobacteria bacterium]
MSASKDTQRRRHAPKDVGRRICFGCILCLFLLALSSCIGPVYLLESDESGRPTIADDVHEKMDDVLNDYNSCNVDEECAEPFEIRVKCEGTSGSDVSGASAPFTVATSQKDDFVDEIKAHIQSQCGSYESCSWDNGRLPSHVMKSNAALSS